MTVVVNTRDDVTLEAYRRVAYGGELVEIGPEARRAIKARRATFQSATRPEAAAASPAAGNGREDKKAHDLWVTKARSPQGFGAGELDEPVVRGIVLARLTNLVAGQAPIRAEVCDRVAALLGGSLPRVPLDGQTGPGESLPLGCVFGVLEDADLDEAEEAALLGGSPCSAALAADTALRARHRLEHAESIFALSIEAFRAPMGAYDPALDELYGDAYEAEALRALRAFLEDVDSTGRRFHQAPVSYRIIPRVLGQLRRAVGAVEKAASVSLRAVTDDTSSFSGDRRRPPGDGLSSSGAYNAAAYPALNALSAAWADLALLGERQVTALNTAETSELPFSLAVPGVPRSGTYAYGWAASGYVEEARAAATPSLLPPAVGDPYDDIMSPTFIAYRRERRAAECLDGALTILALVSSQALFITDRTPPPKLAPLLAFVRSIFPPIVEINERHLSAEATRLQAALAEGAVTGSLVTPPAAGGRGIANTSTKEVP
jgi:histidine ammonia-lyase